MAHYSEHGKTTMQPQNQLEITVVQTPHHQEIQDAAVNMYEFIVYIFKEYLL